MMHDMGGWHWGFGAGHWFFGLLFWLFVLVVIVLLIRAVNRNDK